ncbi:hypothetical protein JSY36_16400 [Bacillus sp. H-16]|uniref:competence type IV pilus minor pilin ComGG n=1 Tax=Alteribacter salitolerans TaxID=2912333 RepID=UPI001962BAFD|nr:competence type IV pilus minor pilin ComGG [Alteribacter salitolerans]MBM7097315.1 hypothetical protein [Alteribacter salitolerans]
MMMKNDKGFVMLTAVFILLVFSGLILHQVTILKSEQSFTAMHWELIQMDNLLLTGKEFVSALILEDDGDKLQLGTKATGDGIIRYEVTLISDDIHFIRLKVETHSGAMREGTFYLNVTTGAVTDWEEGGVLG